MITKSTVVVHAGPQDWGRRDSRVLRASWPAIPAYLTSSKSMGNCLKKNQNRWYLRNGSWRCSLHTWAHKCIPIYTHAPVHREADTQKHPQRKHGVLIHSLLTMWLTSWQSRLEVLTPHNLSLANGATGKELPCPHPTAFVRDAFCASDGNLTLLGHISNAGHENFKNEEQSFDPERKRSENTWWSLLLRLCKGLTTAESLSPSSK